MLSFGSVYLGVPHLGFYLLWFCPLGRLSAWHSAHVILCPLLVLSTLFSTHLWFYLLGIMFIKDLFYLRSCPLGILFSWVLSSWILSTKEPGCMTFCPRRLVSTNDSVNSGFCSRFVLSSSNYVHLGGCLVGIYPLGSLATWHFPHVGWFPLFVLSTLDCALYWFGLLGSPPPGILSTLIPSTRTSVRMTFCPRNIVSSIGSINSVFYSRYVLSTWGFVHLGLYLLWFCPLESLSTWRTFN